MSREEDRRPVSQARRLNRDAWAKLRKELSERKYEVYMVGLKGEGDRRERKSRSRTRQISWFYRKVKKLMCVCVRRVERSDKRPAIIPMTIRTAL